MKNVKTHSKRKGFLALLLAIVLVAGIGSLAIFADREVEQAEFLTDTFTKDGYTLETSYIPGPYIANEDVEATLKEINGKDEDVFSTITMSVKWESPDPDCKIFGHADAADNATLTIAGEPITDYTVSADKSTITFDLPTSSLAANAAQPLERKLVLHIPDSLMGTGEISYTYEKVFLKQNPVGFTDEFTAADLSSHNFAVDVGWAASSIEDINRKALMGYLRDAGNGKYTIEYQFEFGYTSSGMRDFAAKDVSRWSTYKGSVVGLTIPEGVTSIGDYCFTEFAGLTAVTLPESMTAIGTSAFNATSLATLTVPEKVTTIESLAFGYVDELKEITFHTPVDGHIDFTAPAGEDSGAFYVPTHVETTVKADNVEVMYGYRWHDGFDNRRMIPTLAENDRWQYTAYDATDYNNCVTPIDLDLLTKIEIVDYYIPDGTETSWDVSDPSVPGTVTAYLSADKTKVTIAGNGYRLIYANEKSNATFSHVPNYYSFTELKAISGAEVLDVSRVVEARDMFAGNSKLESVNVSNWDTGKIQYTSSSYYSGMFSYCSSLKALDVSKWDTSSMKDMTLMFAGCRALTELDVSKWNTSACESMMDMFSGCESLAEIDVATKKVSAGTADEYTAWDVSNVQNAAGMFEGTTALQTVNVKDWNTANIWTMRRMFNESGIQSLDLSGWNESTVENVEGMFEGCARLTDLNLVGWDLSHVTESGTMLRFCTALEQITFPASLTNYGAFFADGCTKLTTIEFLHAADAEITFANEGGGYNGAFPLSDPYSKTNPLRAKVITVNQDVLNYGWTNDFRGYVVSVDTVTGSLVTVSPVVSINGKTITLDPAVKDGYTYAGSTYKWTENGEEKSQTLAKDVLTFQMPASDVTVTPDTDLIVYDFTFVTNGGTLNNAPTNYTVESPTITLPEPSRTGYTFGGWYTNEGLTGTPVTEIQQGSIGDRTFYAKWNIITYTTSYNLNGGTVATANPATYNIETPTFTLNNPTRTGYIFTGWTGSNGSEPQTTVTIALGNYGNKEYVANWTPVQATVTFYRNLNGSDGTTAQETFTYDVANQSFSNKGWTKTGYTLAGWSHDRNATSKTYDPLSGVSNEWINSHTPSVTLYAVWTPNPDTPYKVQHWQQNLGAAATPQNGSNYTLVDTDNLKGTTDTKVTPARKSYTGFTAPAGTEINIAPDGSAVVNYYYTRNSYTFTLGSNVGVSTNGSTVTGVYQYGTTITLKAAAKAGYTWTTWTSSNTGLVNHTTSTNTSFQLPAGNVTMTPGANLNTYSIGYDLKGGTVSGNPSSYNVTTGSFTLKNPTRTGYTFTGWTGSNGGTPQKTVTIAQGSTGNVSYTANWSANTNTAYTVYHWKQNLGAAATQNSSNYTLADTDYLAGTTDTKVTPARKSYTGFIAPAGTEINIAPNGSAVVNYYYTRNSYTFTLGSAAGVNTTGSSGTGSYQYGATITLKASVSNGYTWTQWTSNTGLVSSTANTNTSFQMPASNVAMTPGATVNTYSISYNLNGGTVSGNPTSYNVTTGSFTLKNPTRSDYTFTGWTGSNGGTPQKTVTIAQGSTGNKSYTANWKSNLASIAVTTLPDKTTYVLGEDFDPTGIVITATYEDGTTKPVTDYTVTNGNDLTLDQSSVTVTYTEDGVTQTVTVPISTLKKTRHAPTPSAVKITSTRIMLNTIQGAEYSIDGTTWQDSTVFSNLSPLTEYTFYARYKETSTHYASAAGSARFSTLDVVPLTVTKDNRGMVGYTGASGENLVIPGYFIVSDGTAYRVIAIADQAFQSCNGLSSVTIPASVTSIGRGAFYDCDNLASVSFESNSQLTSLGTHVFSRCESLTSIAIPSGVTSIGYEAFSFCENLASVSFGSNSKVTYIGEWAFTTCKSLTSITIPAGVTCIDAKAFQRCTNLSNVTILSNSYSTGNEAFAYTNLSSIDLTGAVSIGSYCFIDTKLTSVIFSTGLTYIDEFAFAALDNLTVYYKGSEAQWLSTAKHEYAFASANPLYFVYNYR